MKHSINELAYWSINDVDNQLHPFGNFNIPIHSVDEALEALNVVKAKHPDRDWRLFSCGCDADHYNQMELDDIQNVHERNWMAQIMAEMDAGKTEQQLLAQHYSDRTALKERLRSAA